MRDIEKLTAALEAFLNTPAALVDLIDATVMPPGTWPEIVDMPVLVYDGPAYDWLSYNGAFIEANLTNYRDAVIDLADTLGFYVEDYSCYAMVFYPKNK